MDNKKRRQEFFDLIRVNENRLLIFLEKKPNSDHYEQVLVGKRNFKKISDILFKKVGVYGNGKEAGTITTDDGDYKLPDLQSIN